MTGATATPGECLTLGGHDGSPCSRCGRIARKRPPAIPKGALERERQRHPDRSSHFRSPANNASTEAPQ